MSIFRFPHLLLERDCEHDLKEVHLQKFCKMQCVIQTQGNALIISLGSGLLIVSSKQAEECTVKVSERRYCKL